MMTLKQFAKAAQELAPGYHVCTKVAHWRNVHHDGPEERLDFSIWVATGENNGTGSRDHDTPEAALDAMRQALRIALDRPAYAEEPDELAQPQPKQDAP